MFFGNQVTCEYWDYVWLNEGFASYLEHVIADKVKMKTLNRKLIAPPNLINKSIKPFFPKQLQPGWRILDYFLVNRMHSVMMQDAGPKTHAMTRPINTPDEISKIYDFVAYPKAASVIRMMEHIMKPEIFRKALSVYIDER
jgi:aminopeptidase N